MAKLETLPSMAIIDGFRDVIDFYVHRGIPCARAWPRSPGKARSPGVEAQWPVFKQAAVLFNKISPSVRKAYEDMGAGTNLTPKDLFFRGYISGILRYYIPVDQLPNP